MTLRKSLAFSLLVPALLFQLPVQACGPFFDDPDFSFTLHPDLPLSKFAAGNMGVVKNSMARSYLYVAWRYLSGKPLLPAEQKSIAALWDRRLNSYGTPADSPSVSAWNETRKKLGMDGQSSFYPEKSFSGKDTFFFYTNCPDDAFSYAANTAQQVSRQFGGGSKELKSWIKAQDAVFCNCNGGVGDKATIPSPLEATLNVRLKPYRDYQIASANFYSGKFDLARQQFEKIAQDSSSPFRDLGTYLALRAGVRKAVVAESNDNDLLLQLEKQAKELLNDKSKAGLHAALEDMLGFIRFKVDQRGRFAELTKALSSSSQAGNAGNNLTDFTLALDNLLGESGDFYRPDLDKDPAKAKSRSDGIKFISQSGDLGDWLLTFQGQDKDAARHAILRWHETHQLQWLVAALTNVNEKDAECAKLIDDARKLDKKNSPAYQFLQYQIAAKLGAAGKKAEACKIIEAVISDKTIDLGPSTGNLFINQRLRLSKDFADFLHFALQRPASVDLGYACTEFPADYDKMKDAKTYKAFEPAFSPGSCKFFNAAVPLNLLFSLKDMQGMPARLKADTLQALWVRAFLLNDGTTLSAVSPRLKQSIAALAPLVAAYEKSSTPEEKAFAGAFMILRNPGLRPVITSGYGRRTALDKIDDYQDNWWHKDDLVLAEKKGTKEANAETALDSPSPEDPASGDALAYASCLNQKQKSDAVAENKKIINMGLAPAVLCQDVLAFARKSPQDARLPEALGRAVKATHFGERDATTTKLSRECFNLLHKKYPHNQWSDKTKYFY